MASSENFDIRKLPLDKAAVFDTVIKWDLQLDFLHATKWTLISDKKKDIIEPLPSDKPSELNHFQPGMRVEAIDRVYPQYVCVASILRVVADEVLVYFDGWSNAYNYWCRYDSPEIRPVGTAGRLNMPLSPPSSTSPGSKTNPSWKKGGCGWKGYLEVEKAKAAPDHIFGKLIIPEGSDKFSDLAEKKDRCATMNENGLMSLFEICARVVAKKKIEYSKCPVKIRDKLANLRRCILCEGPFLFGFHAILPWTSVEWLRSKPFSRMSVVCSLKCAEDFVTYRFRIDGSDDNSGPTNRRYFVFHRTFYNSEHEDLKIQSSYAESKGFKY